MEEQSTYNRKSKYDVVIGIDPDVDKNGVAILNTGTNVLTVYSMTFPEAIEHIKTMPVDDTIVYVEAGWLNKAHWHLSRYDTGQSAAYKGNQAGRNHETGRKLIECLKYYNIKVRPVKPFRKTWTGKDGKITNQELKRLCEMSGIVFNASRTNQEERDAALLAITCSGLPIRYKVIESKINKLQQDV